MAIAVFLDKDGTLIPDIPYNVNPALITLSDYAIDGLKQLHEHGYLFVIISNQAGVARGYFKESELSGVEEKLQALLSDHGLKLSGFYYCPHHPEGVVDAYNIVCDCRKPNPGLILKAANELGIDLPNSWMVGDILNDVEAGNRAGCKSVLIDNGNETEWLGGEYRTPTLKCKNINEAAKLILQTQLA